jgi:CheY-like chemotaxis protein
MEGEKELAAREQKSVLVVEDDPGLGGLLQAALQDEGHRVAVLNVVQSDAVRSAVGRLEPDCVLLDGASSAGYGSSWADAAWLSQRDRPVPVVMITGHQAELEEARARQTERSRAARFSAAVEKPFDLDELLAVVAEAVGQASAFDGSAAADARRTERLVARLREAGLQDVVASGRREWATFPGPGGVWLLYWSQRDGVYYLVRQRATDGGFEQVGRFYDLDAAVALATTLQRPNGVGSAVAG